MRSKLIALAAGTAFAALPTFASADPDAAGNAAAGAAVGAGTGFLLGGPVGAAVGAGVGGTVGAGTAPPHSREEVIIDRPHRTPVRERTCFRDASGDVVCHEVRR
jgi:hypothetical protein